MSEDTWNKDTMQSSTDGTATPPEHSASTGGVGDGGGSHAGTRTGDPRSGGTSGTTTGDAPYDLDAGGEGGSDAKTPSGT